SGLSNPWNLQQPGKDPGGFAGVGFELVIESREASEWAVPLLHNLMAYELLVAVGTYQDAELFEYGNRVPLNASITPEFESPLRWLLIEQPKHYPSSFELAAGRVDFFHLVGASDAEVEFARKNSQDNLLQLLKDKGVHPFTDAKRDSVL
ncbi:MAG: suppressor of fused domain protein, partial [Planctomycetota bacterium]|nr:suppressor of fused domain protein [Planctomycetota bacterium]